VPLIFQVHKKAPRFESEHNLVLISNQRISLNQYN